MIRSSIYAIFAVLIACGGSAPLANAPRTHEPGAQTQPTADGKDAGSSGGLAMRPPLSLPKAFEPKAPEVFKTESGVTVWLLSKPDLPIVSVVAVINAGAASEPMNPGLAYLTANMLDEGAGTRNALELSTAVLDLGAVLNTGVTLDGSLVSLTVLKKNLQAGFSIFADVLSRPRFEAKEFERVSDLWRNELKKRADDPALVARVVTSRVLFEGKPYQYPVEGLLAKAKQLKLDTVRRFYREKYLPSRTTLVFSGAITKAEAIHLIEKELAKWTTASANDSAYGKGAPAEAAASKPETLPRLVLVDRPEAPQSVITVARSGISAADVAAAPLELINTALGGSFTSRLNQNLREEHGYTYGARSNFSETRLPGAFLARAAVQTEVTGPALREMLSELSKMASQGLSVDELQKVKAQDRGELVQTYETVSGISRRLGTLAMLEVKPSYDSEASKVRQAATLDSLKPLLEKVDPNVGTIVIVGPVKEILPQLAPLALGEPVYYDVEGERITKKAAPAIKH